jgi:hypothetical protein
MASPKRKKLDLIFHSIFSLVLGFVPPNVKQRQRLSRNRSSLEKKTQQATVRPAKARTRKKKQE